MIDLTAAKSGWKGLVHYARRFLFGGVGKPVIQRYGTSDTPTTSINYESMDANYRWFRQDEIVRRCVVINAVYAAMSAGFTTELEPIQDMPEEEKAAFVEKFKYVKDYVDAINKKVNLDYVLFVAQVKRSIYGKCGFEVILESANGAPSWLLSLQSTSVPGSKLEPEVDENWQLVGFKYDGVHKYGPEEVLYFVNSELENDYLGLSDIEPVRSTCQARNYLLEDDFPEITHNLWAPYCAMEADTSGMNEEEELAFMRHLIESAKSGKSVAFNRSVKATVVSMDVNLTGIVQLMDKLEETIVRAFGIPRFLVNKSPENRATAFVEFESFIQGPIANIQRYFKRELERQWYDRLVKLALAKQGFTGEIPVRIKHVWNLIRTTDVLEMSNAVATLYGGGLGILGEHPEIAFDMMNWDKKLLQEKQTPQTPNSKNPELPGVDNVTPEKR